MGYLPLFVHDGYDAIIGILMTAMNKLIQPGVCSFKVIQEVRDNARFITIEPLNMNKNDIPKNYDYTIIESCVRIASHKFKGLCGGFLHKFK